MVTYRIEARQDSFGGADSERYQVVDDDGTEYGSGASGRIEDTPSFDRAVERYCELTGEAPDSVDGFHDLMIDGVRQTPARSD